MLEHNIWIKCWLRARITFFKVQFNCNILEFESPSFDHQKGRSRAGGGVFFWEHATTTSRVSQNKSILNKIEMILRCFRMRVPDPVGIVFISIFGAGGLYRLNRGVDRQVIWIR